LPSIQEHIAKAKANELLAAKLMTDGQNDWAVTVFFYASLHYIEAYFAITNMHYTAHSRRSDNMIDDAVLVNVHDQYRLLEEASKRARYEARPFSPNEVKQNIVPLLEEIKTYLGKHFGLT
jgi:hypothetical protein